MRYSPVGLLNAIPMGYYSQVIQGPIPQATDRKAGVPEVYISSSQGDTSDAEQAKVGEQGRCLQVSLSSREDCSEPLDAC